MQQESYTKMSIATLLEIAKTKNPDWEKSKYLSTLDWINYGTTIQ